MNGDVSGCSVCQVGDEKYEYFVSVISKKRLIQYEYRHPSGKLFTTVTSTLENARRVRDVWIDRGMEIIQ